VQLRKGEGRRVSMRIHIVVDETAFFLPAYVRYVVENLPADIEIVGVTVLKNPADIPTVYSHLRSHLSDIGLGSCLRLGWQAVGQMARVVAGLIGLSTRPGSVAGTIRRRGIPVRCVTGVNAPETLYWIRLGAPDLVLSSCSQIFRADLLAIPRVGSINRHSSLLPSYGGVLPIFQALSRGESRVGSSIHVMTEQVDGGTLVAQSGFAVTDDMTVYDCYERSYADCGPLTIQALERIRDLGPRRLEEADFGVTNNLEQSYFKMPTDEDWERFHRTHRRFC
jgi:methionyl-tRNA formyltransferase